MSDSQIPGSQNPAVQTLQSFFAAMHVWEHEMIQELEDVDTIFAGMTDHQIEEGLKQRSREARARLKAIFDEFCEAGSSATRVNDVLHHGSREPDYDPQKERILSVTTRGDKTIVETQMTHNSKFKLRYELVKVNGQWRIRDNRKCWADESSKWSRWNL